MEEDNRHLQVLEEKHRLLDEEISKLERHVAIDHVDLVELKKQKLKLKDEISRLAEKN